MNLAIQYRIKNNPNNLKFLRENSHWYKYLNRNKSYIKSFEDEMKKNYRLTTVDRMSKIADGIDMVSKIMDILN